MFKVRTTAKARRELKKISQLHKQAIAQAVEEIKEDPYVGKPLSKELIGRFSYKIDVYRIIYKVNKKDKTIIIITAGHRANIYS